jgi:hypothetical protein
MSAAVSSAPAATGSKAAPPATAEQKLLTHWHKLLRKQFSKVAPGMVYWAAIDLRGPAPRQWDIKTTERVYGKNKVRDATLVLTEGGAPIQVIGPPTMIGAYGMCAGFGNLTPGPHQTYATPPEDLRKAQVYLPVFSRPFADFSEADLVEVDGVKVVKETEEFFKWYTDLERAAMAKVLSDPFVTRDYGPKDRVMSKYGVGGMAIKESHPKFADMVEDALSACKPAVLVDRDRHTRAPKPGTRHVRMQKRIAWPLGYRTANYFKFDIKGLRKKALDLTKTITSPDGATQVVKDPHAIEPVPVFVAERAAAGFAFRKVEDEAAAAGLLADPLTVVAPVFKYVFSPNEVKTGGTPKAEPSSLIYLGKAPAAYSQVQRMIEFEVDPDLEELLGQAVVERQSRPAALLSHLFSDVPDEALASMEMPPPRRVATAPSSDSRANGGGGATDEEDGEEGHPDLSAAAEEPPTQAIDDGDDTDHYEHAPAPPPPSAGGQNPRKRAPAAAVPVVHGEGEAEERDAGGGNKKRRKGA